ncbi:MAG TPA: hypothetical protein VEV45_25145 [Streptosporangiaceae bacterium]|nr:hypothetical protein [Streptosporangiaceae bacterium]
MRRYLIVGALAAGLLATAPTAAFAIVNPTTGQKGAPTNTCGPDNPMTPGNSANVKGSPFNANGIAGLHYAGNPDTHSLANSNSTATVSQYDNACVRLSSH